MSHSLLSCIDEDCSQAQNFSHFSQKNLSTDANLKNFGYWFNVMAYFIMSVGKSCIN